MAKINIGLLTADLDSGNMGCNALTYSAIFILEEIARKIKHHFDCFLLRDIDAHSGMSIDQNLYFGNFQGEVRVLDRFLPPMF